MDQALTPTELQRRRGGPLRPGAAMEVPLRLRVTRETADAIAVAAKAADETNASWIRGTIARALDLGAEHRQRVGRYGGGPDTVAMTALRMQLHGLGGLLTQVAKTSRIDGAATLHAEAEATLAEVRQAIAVIAEWQAVRLAGAVPT